MNKAKTLLVAAVAVWLMLLPLPAAAQGGIVRIQIHTIEVDQQTGHVHAYFSVLNQAGEAISGLDASSLSIKDNGEQLPEDAYHIEAARNGIAAIILIDCSGSMVYPKGISSNPPRIQHARELIQEFTDRYLVENDDYVGIVKFNYRVTPLLALGPHSPNDTYNAYVYLDAEENTNTALYSAIRMAMDWFETDSPEVNRAVARRKNVILVFSDGNDGMNPGDPEYLSVAKVESRFAARDYDTPVFSIGINTVSGLPPVYQYEGDDVNWLSQATVGQYVEYVNRESLPAVRAAFELIEALGYGYHLEFAPRKQEANHTLRIQLSGREGHVEGSFSYPYEMPQLGAPTLDPPAGTYQVTEEILEVQVTMTTTVSFPDDLPRQVGLLFSMKENGQAMGDPAPVILDAGAVEGGYTWAIPTPPLEGREKLQERPLTFQVELYDSLFVEQEPVRSDPVAIKIVQMREPTCCEKLVEALRTYLPFILVPAVVALAVLLFIFRRQVAAAQPVQGVARAFNQVTRRLTLSPVKATLKTVQGLNPGTEYKLRDDRIAIGRNEQCQVTIPDEFVSREHAIIESQGGRFTLTDVSSNGTLLNGSQMTQNMAYSLESGYRIQIGDTVLEFQTLGGPKTQPVPDIGVGGRMPHDGQPGARPTRRVTPPGTGGQS
jgi:hypothetical protein